MFLNSAKKRFISTNKNLAVKHGEKINKIYFRGSAEKKKMCKKAEKSMSKKLNFGDLL